MQDLSETVILTPTYNERDNIRHLVQRVFSLHPDVHVLVIDDNSPDGTADAVRELTRSYPHLLLLSRQCKSGLGEAYKAGIAQVLRNKNVVSIITMDADGSHDPGDLAALREQGRIHDVVVGSRYTSGGRIEKWERWRHMLSRSGNTYARAITGLPFSDVTAGFIHLRASKLRELDLSTLHSSGYAFLIELKWALVKRLCASATEVPITFKSRREGESKISNHVIMEGIVTPWRVRYGASSGSRSPARGGS